jgi:hypothetical protein
MPNLYWDYKGDWSTKKVGIADASRLVGARPQNELGPAEPVKITRSPPDRQVLALMPDICEFAILHSSSEIAVWLLTSLDGTK